MWMGRTRYSRACWSDREIALSQGLVANDFLSDTRPRVQESGRNQPFLSDVHDRVLDIVTVVTPPVPGSPHHGDRAVCRRGVLDTATLLGEEGTIHPDGGEPWHVRTRSSTRTAISSSPSTSGTD